MTALCEGKCGKTVTEAGKWCSGCWVPGYVLPEPIAETDPIRPTQDLQSIRFEIHSASFNLCFGREAQKAEALERLSHLVHVLQQEQHLTKKD